MKGTNYPIIPVYIGGAWGSIFSYRYGRILCKWPLAISYPVNLLFGAALPPTSSAAEVRLAVQVLSIRSPDLL